LPQFLKKGDKHLMTSVPFGLVIPCSPDHLDHLPRFQAFECLGNLGHDWGRDKAKPSGIVLAVVLVQAPFRPDIAADDAVQGRRHIPEDLIKRGPSVVEIEPSTAFRKVRPDRAVIPNSELLSRDDPQASIHAHDGFPFSMLELVLRARGARIPVLSPRESSPIKQNRGRLVFFLAAVSRRAHPWPATRPLSVRGVRQQTASNANDASGVPGGGRNSIGSNVSTSTNRTFTSNSACQPL
jgi:hypothetical protein